jgi:hypothetical protein
MRRERGTGSIYPRGGVCWIKYYKNGSPALESSGSTSKTRAKRLLQTRPRAVSSGEPFRLGMEKIKVAELAQDFLQDLRINGLKSLQRCANALDAPSSRLVWSTRRNGHN